MLDRRRTLLAAAALVASPYSSEAPALRRRGLGPSKPAETIDLWPKGMLDIPAGLVERVEERSKISAHTDRAVHGIIAPRLEVFRPTKPNGSAILVTPGGGYRRVVVDKEGYEIGRRFAADGWTVFVLFYRLPGEGWAGGANVALADAQRAMRLIRARARDYAVNPERVAAMGFSAGGHVCGDLATRYDVPAYAPIDAADQLSARPSIAALIYAVQSMAAPLAHAGSRAQLIGNAAAPDLEQAHSPAHNVTDQTPPCFLVHAEDDHVVLVENTLAFRAALKAENVPVETHLFQNGGHGFGLSGALGKPAQAWPDLFAQWASAWGFG